VIKAAKNKVKLAEKGVKNLIVYKEKYSFNKKMDAFIQVLRNKKEKHV
jgi:predicted porin